MTAQTLQLAIPGNDLDSYLQRIYTIPILTLEQEQELARRFQEQADLKAAQQLVLSHLRYVAKIARGYLGYGLALGDLIQEGTVGLMKAVKRFKPEVGVRLVSFAVHWIKAEIREFILRNWRLVKVATTKAQRLLFSQLPARLKAEGSFTLDEAETVARDLNVSVKQVREMEHRLLYARELPLELPYPNTTFAPIDHLEAPQTERDEAEVSSEALQAALATLDPRSRDILAQRWLQQEDKGTTLRELADRYQISMERVRQLEQQAMRKLKTILVTES